MRILINDHAGHPFQVQLSRSLAGRGHDVLHTFTAHLQTPRGTLQRRDTDPDGLKIKGISIGEEFSRYSMLKRVMQEQKLGKEMVKQIEAFKPNAVISANTPLFTQAAMIGKCRREDINFCFWVQDLLGIGIRNNLRKKLPVVGHVIGVYFIKMEESLFRKSDEIILITEDFLEIMGHAGVNRKKVHVINNWAPLDEVPVYPKSNSWSRANGFDQKTCLIYSGTLGMKHNPGLLVELALALKDREDVLIIVITEGLGADYLGEEKLRRGLANLRLLPFQPFADIPMVLACADVLLAVLEPDAGIFAVPSKVLTCLCAQRPLLLSVPPENLAARIVKENKAGIVVPPSDSMFFVNAAMTLLDDPELRSTLGKNGRAYAETTFAIEKITDKFEKILFN